MTTAGILLSFIALFGWGFGDFFMQRAIRKLGIWETLFPSALGGALVLLFLQSSSTRPFIVSSAYPLFLMVGLFAIGSAALNLKALHLGKISVIAPLIGLELPMTIGLSVMLGHERPEAFQWMLMAVVFLGITMAVTGAITPFRDHTLEEGVIFAVVGAFFLASTNFLVGTFSRETNPLATLLVTHSFIAAAAFAYLLYRRKVRSSVRAARNNLRYVLAAAVPSLIGWISYAYATTIIPISIAITISECYIALAVLLGLYFNKEKLLPHQKAGIAIAIGGVIALSAI